MRVDVADAAAEQGVAIDELEDFAIPGHDGGGQSRRADSTTSRRLRLLKASSPMTKGCARTRFASSSATSAAAKTGDPDGRVSQNHAEAGRRRGAAAEPRQPPRAFPLDERFQRLADQARFLLEARELLSLRTNSSSSANVVRIPVSGVLAIICHSLRRN